MSLAVGVVLSTCNVEKISVLEQEIKESRFAALHLDSKISCFFVVAGSHGIYWVDNRTE